LYPKLYPIPADETCNRFRNNATRGTENGKFQKKRGKIYYAQYCIGGEVFRVSLKTDSLQVAKDKLRQIESSMARGADLPIPTRTPIAEVVAAYVEHIRATKTRNGYKVDLW
jgi:hypothetical protein